MPHPLATPRTPGADLLPRLHATLASRTGRRVVAALNALVLVVALGPFLVWEGVGPARFEDVELGQRPEAPSTTDHPLTDPDVESEADWVAQLPYELSPTTTVTLVFSVGSRGMDAAEAEQLRVHDVDDRGGDGLTDSMMLVVADRATRQVALLSLPRDLWLHDRGHRINATFNRHGLQAFVDDVARVTGLPVHHLVQVNFGAFARLVDAVGGVPLAVDRALADVPAVLYVPEPGCWHFDGAAALAWARGRHTLTKQDGAWVTDRTASDFGRIERQQALLRALWDQVRRPGAITSLPEVIGVARDGMVVDGGLGVQQVRDLLAVFGEMAAGAVEGHTYPTRGQRIGRAAAQVAVEQDAAPLLTRLRTWPPGPDDAAAAASRPVVDDTVVLAAPEGPLLAAEGACTRDRAQPLPDPRPPLGGVVASRGGSEATEQDGDGTDGTGDVETADTAEPGPGPGGPDPGEEDGTSPPSEPEGGEGDAPPPSEAEEPSEEPSEDEDDDGPLPLPLPGGGG